MVRPDLSTRCPEFPTSLRVRCLPVRSCSIQRSILKWLNRTPKSKSRERSVLRPVTPCVSMATHQAPQLGAPPVSQAPSHPCDKTRSKLRFQNPFSSGKTQHARQKAVSHNGKPIFFFISYTRWVTDRILIIPLGRNRKLLGSKSNCTASAEMGVSTHPLAMGPS